MLDNGDDHTSRHCHVDRGGNETDLLRAGRIGREDGPSPSPSPGLDYEFRTADCRVLSVVVEHESELAEE